MTKIEYYIIRGRGENGAKFQLAKLENEDGNNFKGQYDMSKHFSSVDELKSYVADEVLKVDDQSFEFAPMNI